MSLTLSQCPESFKYASSDYSDDDVNPFSLVCSSLTVTMFWLGVGFALASLPIVSSALNITVLQPNVSFVPTPLPAPFAARNADAIASAFSNLGRTTVWNLIRAIPLQGDLWEPEGMVRIGADRIVISAGEYTSATVTYGKDTNGTSVIINGTDRSAGSGFAHLVVFDGNGTRIADATISEAGSEEYHNGGIDYDGEYIWATIAQYRPNTTATLVRVDPSTLEPTPLYRIADHQGGVVHDTETEKLYTLNWGSRNSSVFPSCPDGGFYSATFTRPAEVRRNPSYFVDYQDCKFLGHPKLYDRRSTMICSGVATIGSGNSSYNLGGIALVDTETMVPVAEVPITLSSELGQRITQNPMDVDVVDGRLRLYWLPDQHNSTLYIYEAQPDSPFEYGGEGGAVW
ncbi:hypothetical protein EHS25_002292 [Saitozyma podzolica]|uniref:Uncharacterized protein n=1 Tax=Saitozyma podzolica TaxID=1890683 RepID=A0A427YDH9_9TREE|nr:hypothetical protein EHS25_002292 [Saitozyma podzolica]